MRAERLSANGAKYMRAQRLSAEGAKYESQGQALSGAKRVAPGNLQKSAARPERPK